MNGSMSEFNTPNIEASEAVLVLHSSTVINAPAVEVFRALRNTETWKDWNRFVPKVNITYQPPEQDTATAAEIQELVRNTSIIGSFYSDLTDGGIGVARPRSPDEQPPPRFRLNSISSRMSGDSQGPPSNRASIDQNVSSDQPKGSTVSNDSDALSPTRKISAAHKFQQAQETRRSSIASGEEPPAIVNRVENTATHRGSLAIPSPASLGSKRRKPKYTQTVAPGSKAAQRAHQALMVMYGEPSVRLQIKTKMTFFVRMKPNSPSDFTETKIVVTDVSRPDDPIGEADTTALTRSKTHNLERSGTYRVIWANDTEATSILNVGSMLKGNMPKYFLQAERVHEIQPTGAESCIYKTWECQKGHAAKTVKKKYGDYIQKMFEIWGSGLKDFCEGLYAPKIDRRDFSISLDEAPILIQSLT